MNSGQIVLSQVMDFIPMYEFRKCVDRYTGNRKIKSFSCWNQFLCMAFAQLTYRDSLRDIEACFRSSGSSLYHMGIRGKVARNTMSNANAKRDWRIYSDFAQVLIRRAVKLYSGDNICSELQEPARNNDQSRGPIPCCRRGRVTEDALQPRKV